MLSVATLTVPSHLHAQDPRSLPTLGSGLSPQDLQGLTAIDSNNRRRRPGRQVSIIITPPRSLTEDLTYDIRHMNSKDMPAVVQLMKDEGWNVDFDNMAAVYCMQPHAYFVAQSSRGEIVGYCNAVCLNNEVGMLSYILISSHHQKQGLGTRLMAKAKEALDGRTMAFYSVEDAVPFYKSRRFDTRRFSTLVRDFTLTSADFPALPHLNNITVVKAQNVSFDKLSRYDSDIQGMERADYLRHWILRDSNVAFAAVDTTSGQVVGYLSLSFYNGRWDINPLYSDSDEIAMLLLKKASLDIAEPIRAFVRIPADSSKAIKLFSKLRDTQHHRVLYLMSDEPLPGVTSDKVYSLSTVCYGLK